MRRILQLLKLHADFPVMVSVGPWILLTSGLPALVWDFLELEGLLEGGCARLCPSRPLETDSSRDCRSGPIIEGVYFQLGEGGALEGLWRNPCPWRDAISVLLHGVGNQI